MITDEDMHKAIANIARTPEGLLLYRWLQKQLLAVPTVTDPQALTAHNGERRFAAQLMGLMSEAVAEQAIDGPDGIGGPSERPVVFAVRQPAGKPHRSAREYFRAELSSAVAPTD